jgi:hypothetical protein
MKQIGACEKKLKQPQNGPRNQPQEVRGLEPGRSTRGEDTYKNKMVWLV